MGTYCKNLAHVDVAWCVDITDLGVIQFSESCTTLKYLCLTRCDQVNDDTTLDLCDKYPNVEYSTMYLDCQRLIAEAQRQGFVIKNIPKNNEMAGDVD